MQQLEELTSVIERLTAATTFKMATDLLTDWSRGFTGCQAAMLRLLVDGGRDGWLGSCVIDGASASFARDEALVGASECMCGRVTAGNTDAALPFFTSGGSFRWGRMSTVSGDFSADQTGFSRGRCIDERYESVAIFPLKAGGSIVGSLHLADSRPDWFAQTATVVEAVCRLAGDILLRHRASERDTSLLDMIQSALLPAQPPHDDGLSIGVRFGSATEMARLGGDFYDVFDLGDAGVLLLVGDVSGKGLEAAGVATRTRYALEAQASETPDPARFMQAANSALIRQLPPDRFVTAVACLIQPRTGLVKICLAGHPSPLHFNNGSSAEIEAPHNPPLGVFTDAHFEEAAETFAPGDVLLVYTDGVTDSRRGSQDFGIEGICTAVRTIADHDPDRIATTVCAAATDYHDPSLPGDDRLVMAVRLN